MALRDPNRRGRMLIPSMTYCYVLISICCLSLARFSSSALHIQVHTNMHLRYIASSELLSIYPSR
ncbi:hypothetical protein BJ508DRAFT_152272 [Ascobolus immersus RN42]|uniref:Uncharacterized protein n=1 Tax=Ascobolus immersus RN42 TaxID=1160509 RepID=A0A3N4I038_ASCIM|nr:hypothetical protein BJ508DRAFT_152272 [Ascobolus immersus RN42]